MDPIALLNYSIARGFLSSRFQGLVSFSNLFLDPKRTLLKKTRTKVITKSWAPSLKRPVSVG